ncbi:RNA 3'-terminal phosphate cyclase [Halovivax ruber XH-70]|uniref:RNA 3'-terminal phosphate cyclase n=1 Tax=Halovivax ruber (strain DSM 18193 / JCM 13892 / XH-70) TaxID=797302 RepID=L0I8K0_HALRX|nr:RNA 3'-terminal phosphate cyclase [Halovivax ruber]AGB15138.1 RNA 3'-terminal phosphate cyclase [Halovivax ruber XH-70]
MRELDGSDAGGQFLRSALSLAAIRGDPVRIENVRGDRSTPGLRPQHLAVVETLADICDADIAGADGSSPDVGSETVTFEPGLGAVERSGSSRSSDDSTEREASTTTEAAIPGGAYDVDLGTAGSLTLLFDAVLPLATRLEAPLTLTATGGTDVKWSPTLDYYRRVKLPLLRRFGLQAALSVDRRGFYPAGGGDVTLYLAPSSLDPIRLDERGTLHGVRLYSTESASLADQNVAERQLRAAMERLEGVVVNSEQDDDLVTERVVTTARSDSPGSAIVCRLDFETGIAGTDVLGERGKPAERVGEEAATAAVRLVAGTAPVDRHLADQLLVPLALAGGRVRVPAVTDHVEASLSLLDAFGHNLVCEPVPATDDGSEPVDSDSTDHLVTAT